MIALLTDFHTSDGIGQVKGVMKSVNPNADIQDLYNFVAPFMIRSGAWVLLQGYKFFPKWTIFYCVVDPEVGGERKCIAIKTKNYFFVGPDNGLMYPAASEDGIKTIIELLIPQDAAKTFHGRDVFAPAAAKLDSGIKIEILGKGLQSLQKLSVRSSGGSGEIMLIEHYGNIVTNIPLGEKKSSYSVSCGSSKKNLNFHTTYSEASEGELFIIEGSRNTLELSVKQGSAASMLRCKVGDTVSMI